MQEWRLPRSAQRKRREKFKLRPTEFTEGEKRSDAAAVAINQMYPNPNLSLCEKAELTCAYLLKVLPAGEVAVAEAHIISCPDCRHEVESLRPVVDRFVCWPTDVLRPTTSLQQRLALRIAEETDGQPMRPPPRQWCEPDWERIAPGIECKLLATDTRRHRVSMLVRLAPGASYPAHTHAGGEELHLLDGGLCVDGRKLFPGDYNYGAPGALGDDVWSAMGCTCILVTSTEDLLNMRASV